VNADVYLTRRRAALALLLAGLPLHGQAKRHALPPELSGELPGARLLGAGSLRYLGLLIYDIRLWAPGTDALREPGAAPLALELEYARSLGGRAIAERSLKEMQGIDTVATAQGERWLAQMQQIFPDVKEGDRLTGVQRPGEAARFFVNGQARGEVRDAEFTRLFFGIWLSPRTSQPRLREALLGVRGAAS
jgi:Chalcone isomerase-like